MLTLRDFHGPLACLSKWRKLVISHWCGSIFAVLCENHKKPNVIVYFWVLMYIHQWFAICVNCWFIMHGLCRLRWHGKWRTWAGERTLDLNFAWHAASCFGSASVLPSNISSQSVKSWWWNTRCIKYHTKHDTFGDFLTGWWYCFSYWLLYFTWFIFPK